MSPSPGLYSEFKHVMSLEHYPSYESLYNIGDNEKNQTTYYAYSTVPPGTIA